MALLVPYFIIFFLATFVTVLHTTVDRPRDMMDVLSKRIFLAAFWPLVVVVAIIYGGYLLYKETFEWK